MIKLFRISVDPHDGSFDPRRDVEIVHAASATKALRIVRDLPWVRRFPNAEVKVVDTVTLEVIVSTEEVR